jgi:hypothetical protein
MKRTILSTGILSLSSAVLPGIPPQEKPHPRGFFMPRLRHVGLSDGNGSPEKKIAACLCPAFQHTYDKGEWIHDREDTLPSPEEDV